MIYKISDARIEELLKSTYRRRGCYNYLSILDIIAIMAYLEKHLKSDKGNWSKKNYIEYINKHKISKYHFAENLAFFYLTYSVRKNKALTFYRYIQSCNKFLEDGGNLLDASYNKLIADKKKQIRIKDKKYIYDFLIELKSLYDNYLNGGSHDDWLNLINKKIDLGNTQAVIRKKYFDS